MKNYVGDDKNVDDRGYSILPVKRVSIPVDEKLVRANGTVNAEDSIVSSLQFEFPKTSLQKNDMAILNVIAANQWKRPIYFTMPFGDLGFGDYLRKDGLTYRLVPIKQSNTNTDHMFDVVMNKFSYGNAQLPNVYFDELNRQQLNNLRRSITELAGDLSMKGRKADAVKVLNKADAMMLRNNVPYSMVSRGNEHNRTSLYLLEACYRADNKPMAAKISKEMKTGLQQEIRYYTNLSGNANSYMQYDLQSAQNMLKDVETMEKMKW
jgi:hypothetical protein